MDFVEAPVIRQHLIDPEICIRCNTCEATCPVGAITHDARNYVVDAEKCNLCMACIPPCPTGSIDNWRIMPRATAYGLDAQLSWDALPPELSVEELADAGVAADSSSAAAPAPASVPAIEDNAFKVADYAATMSAVVGRSPLREPLRAPGSRKDDRGRCRRQRARDRGRQGLRHPPHRARFRRDSVSRSRRAVDRRHPTGLHCRRPAASPPTVFDREPAQRRAARLQQCVAHREAGARGPSGPAGAGRRQQLSVRPRRRRQGRDHRTLRR